MNSITQERPNEDKESGLTALAAALLLFFSEQFLLIFLLRGELSYASAFGVHIALTALLIPLILACRKQGKDLRLIITIALLTLFFGPIGALIGLLTILLYYLFRPLGLQSEKLLESLMPEFDDPLPQTLYERIEYGLDEFNPEKRNFLSFEDVIAYGNEQQKRTIIGRILNFFRPEFSKALLIALNDPDNAIRVLAATATTHIDSQYLEKYDSLAAALEKKPKDPSALAAFAAHSDAYSKLLIVDRERRDLLRSSAITAYRRLIALEPNNVTAKLALAQLLFIAGEFSAVVELFETAGTIEDEAYKWLLKSLFALKRYETIRRFSKHKHLHITGENVDHDLIVDQIMLWKHGC